MKPLNLSMLARLSCTAPCWRLLDAGLRHLVLAPGLAIRASSWYIDMNLSNWTAYTFSTFISVFWRAPAQCHRCALAGLVVAIVYNAVAGMMGGLKLNIE